MKLDRKYIVSSLLILPILLVTSCGSGTAFRMPDPNVLFVAFGDSTTAGPSERDYPDILREKLDQPPETFSNEGRGGESTEEGLERLGELIEFGIFPNAQIFIYWEGGNDISEFIADHDRLLLFSPEDPDYPFPNSLANLLAEITTNIRDTVRLARGAGWEVHVATFFPIVANFGECPALPLDIILPGQAINANAYIRLLNDSIRSAAATGGANVLDVSSIGDLLTADSDNYFNCNHLSAVGNEIVAQFFANELLAGGMLTLR
ncbi:MAG: SGNH/GDSL hydrolase family protein [Planctomycetes bacterium]|nr:SGNH/GDSL hydrolase family protein [Planctomycetota bacterium]